MRRRWFMSGPNAFSMRRAISGVSAALAWRRSESVARRTFKTPAAFDTLRPRASMISVLIRSPGWGGFVMIPLCTVIPYAGKDHRGLAGHDRPRNAMVCPRGYLKVKSEEQRPFDSTCWKLHRFLTQPHRRAGNSSIISPDQAEYQRTS